MNNYPHNTIILFSDSEEDMRAMYDLGEEGNNPAGIVDVPGLRSALKRMPSISGETIDVGCGTLTIMGDINLLLANDDVVVYMVVLGAKG